MLKRIKKAIKNPKLILLFFLNSRIFRLLPDDLYLKIKYRLTMGRKLDLNNPETFNQKLQWLKLYDRKPEYTQMVDKYEVRKYIKEIIGEEYLIPLLGVYDSFEEIDFDNLPDEFVLKPNHTSGDVFICRDKSKIDYKKLRNEVNKWLKREYFWLHREWPYKNVKPRILCEKYLVDESGKELIDYKFMCFNSEVKCIFVCSNRNSPLGLNIDIYNVDWNLMPFGIPNSPRTGVKIPKPRNFNKMIEFAEKLAKDIPFIRVDFYEVDGHLYFGELTFYPGAGFEEFTPEKYDYVLGSWIELPKNVKENKSGVGEHFEL